MTAVKGFERAKRNTNMRKEGRHFLHSFEPFYFSGCGRWGWGEPECQGVLWCSYSRPLAVQGRKPFKPETQSTLDSFEQEEQGRLNSLREQRVGAKANWGKRNAAMNETHGASLLWEPWPWAPDRPEEPQEMRDRIITERVSPEGGEPSSPDRIIHRIIES